MILTTKITYSGGLTFIKIMYDMRTTYVPYEWAVTDQEKIAICQLLRTSPEHIKKIAKTTHETIWEATP